MPKQIRFGKVVAKLSEARLVLFGRKRIRHLTAFFSPNRDGFVTPHVTDGRTQRKHWLPRFLPEGFGRALNGIKDDLLSLWSETSEPVDLQRLESDGWLALTQPPGALEWFARKFEEPKLDLLQLCEQYFVEFYDYKLPLDESEQRPASVQLLAALRKHAAPLSAIGELRVGIAYTLVRISDAGTVEGIILSGYRCEDGTVAFNCRSTDWISHERLAQIFATHLSPKVWETALEVGSLLGIDLDRARLDAMIEMARAAR
jgi:hypothetical protein